MGCRRNPATAQGAGRSKRSETYHCDASAHLITALFSLPLWDADHKEAKVPHAHRLGMDFPKKKLKKST